MAPRKALKVSAGPTAHQAAEAQTAVQPDVASVGANLKRSAVQEEAPRAATEQTEGEGPTPRIAEAHESDGAKAPLVAEAASKAEAPGTTEAKMVEVCAAGPVARDSEMEVGNLWCRPWPKACHRHRRAPERWRFRRPLLPILPGGRIRRMSRRTAPPSSQF